MKFKLADIVDINMGQSPKSEFYNNSEEGLPFLQGNRTFGYKYPSYDTYTTQPTKIANAGDVIMSVRAPVGDLNIITKDICIGRGLCALRMKNNNQEFLFYLMKHYSKELINKESGTVFGSINRNDISSLEVDIPENTETQAKIADYLSKIDAKIELNNSINNNLEQQAMALFKSWFIDFEPFNGAMPDNWFEDILGNFIEIKRGGSPRPIQDYISDSGYRWLKISDATSIQSPFILNIKEHIKESGINKTVFLKAGSLVLSNSATPGIPKILDVDSCIHDGWLYFPESKLSNEYLYLLFKFIRPNLVALGNGSVFTNLKTDILRNYNTILPDKETLKQFDNIASAIFKKILYNTREIEKLIQLRDTLLPKLMSGEIDVSNADISTDKLSFSEK
ncbi:restriction endonuclease subunit S [bacterium]|nr:restriction endonuclease subunit S [bacterium]